MVVWIPLKSSKKCSITGDLPEVVHPLLPDRTTETPKPVLGIKKQ
jgi:hypothetical protein